MQQKTMDILQNKCCCKKQRTFYNLQNLSVNQEHVLYHHTNSLLIYNEAISALVIGFFLKKSYMCCILF